MDPITLQRPDLFSCLSPALVCQHPQPLGAKLQGPYSCSVDTVDGGGREGGREKEGEEGRKGSSSLSSPFSLTAALKTINTSGDHLLYPHREGR